MNLIRFLNTHCCPAMARLRPDAPRPRGHKSSWITAEFICVGSLFRLLRIFKLTSTGCGLDAACFLLVLRRCFPPSLPIYYEHIPNLAEQCVKRSYRCQHDRVCAQQIRFIGEQKLSSFLFASCVLVPRQVIKKYPTGLDITTTLLIEREP